MSLVVWAALTAVAGPLAEDLGAEPTGSGGWGDEAGWELPAPRGPLRTGPVVFPSPIVNGDLSAPRPNLVALAGMDGSGAATVFCSGSVIQETWVITAAHCITGSASIAGYGLELVVLWGEDITGEGYTHAIPWASSAYFPGYTESAFVDDIGVVELVEPIPDWAEITVLNDEPLDDAWVGTELTFVGYGITMDGGSDAGTLHETQIPIESWDDSNIYAYSPGSNVCQGDSGGPSFRIVNNREEQVGINAFVTPGCAGGSSGSTNIANYLDFVMDYVPDVLLEPVPEGPEGGSIGFGVAGAAYGPGIGQRFGGREGPGAGVGCSTSGSLGSFGYLAWAAAATLGLRRRR